ncbi:MAG TPA: phosphatidylinositol-specific phospholipase C/glycerophosphodiester phosphodiesterase family protein [Fimbriimonadaceae bacterium]|nr:phosphatidylinositol-specific phospholipase C/glycerophosphodiester phosphodiesterase family protein [Fimbriimonadaceae bacterium]
MLALLATPLLFAQASPLLRAHAHNDYAQPRPLAGAMELQFCSIEADVFLVDGKLLVGHNRKDLKPDRMLDAMYLRPLSQAAQQHGGHVYAQPAEVTLLVDIKEDGAAVYEELKRELRPYDSFLTHYGHGKVEKRAVTVILSGDRPISVLAQEDKRVAFIDGRPDEPAAPASLVPLVSQSWGALFRWKGVGEMPAEEQASLAALVKKCHKAGQKLRFWGTPETTAMWQALYDAGVDLVGTDRQKDLADFLRSQSNRGYSEDESVSAAGRRRRGI